MKKNAIISIIVIVFVLNYTNISLAKNENEEAKIIVTSGKNLNAILTHTKNKKNIETQKSSMAKYTEPLVKSDKKISLNERYAINNFITYGTGETKKLTSKQRYDLVKTFTAKNKKVPKTELDWKQVLTANKTTESNKIISKKLNEETFDLYIKKSIDFYFTDETDLFVQIKDKLKSYKPFMALNEERQNDILNKVMTESKKIPVKSASTNTSSSAVINLNQVDLFPILGDGYFMSKIFNRNVDLSFFGLSRSPYSRNDKYIYNNSTRMPATVSLGSFVVLDERWAKDINYVYRDASIVKDIADPKTFELVAKNLGKDKLYQYSINSIFTIKRLDDFDVQSAQLILTVDEIDYYRDKTGLYFVRTSGDIKGRFANGENSLKLIGSSDHGIGISMTHYLMAGNAVYAYLPWRTEKYASFDKEGVYKIEGADVNTFEVLENKTSLNGSLLDARNAFAKDKNKVYFANKIIAGADSKTFQSLWGGYGKDSANYYYHDQKLSNIDAATFEVLDCGYAKDKNQVFYGTSIISEADPTTFEVLNYGRAKDKKHTYENGVISA
ncbi:MAG: DKNYY domain-containing protein [Candidatus Falkowbacteria bacterium]